MGREMRIYCKILKQNLHVVEKGLKHEHNKQEQEHTFTCIRFVLRKSESEGWKTATTAAAALNFHLCGIYIFN